MKKTIEDIKRELFWDFLRTKFLTIRCFNEKRNWKRFKKNHNLINTELASSDRDFIIMNNPLHFLKGESSNLKVPISVIDKFIKQKDILLYTFEK